MRALLTIVTIFIVLGAAAGSADARPYDRRDSFWAWHSAWCLKTDGATDCGYPTLEQCLVSRSGVGGSCDPNPFYVPSAAAGKPRKQKRVVQ